MELNHAAVYACCSPLRAAPGEGEETRLKNRSQAENTLRYSSFKMKASIADREDKFQAARSVLLPSVQPESRKPFDELARELRTLLVAETFRIEGN